MGTVNAVKLKILHPHPDLPPSRGKGFRGYLPEFKNL
jgi:hypothetical protein